MNNVPVPEIAGYAAEVHKPDGTTIVYGYGVNRGAALRDARYQFMGAPEYWLIACRKITLRPLTPDEASEMAEYLATPWAGL